MSKKGKKPAAESESLEPSQPRLRDALPHVPNSSKHPITLAEFVSKIDAETGRAKIPIAKDAVQGKCPVN